MTIEADRKKIEPKRLHNIVLKDGHMVYGLGNPKNNSSKELQRGERTTETAVLARLHQFYKVDVVISLHESHDSQPAVDKVPDLELEWIPLEDICGLVPFGQLPPTHNVKDLERICDTVDECRSQGKVVAIFCGAGHGRTGTALACLVLTDMYKENPGLLDRAPELAEIKGSNGEILEVPKSVADSITMVRMMTGNEEYVESASDIASLVEYHDALTAKLTKELGADQESVNTDEPDPPSLPPRPES